MLLRTDSFLDRLVSTGPLSEQDARDFACVGPVARGSGIDLDTRRDLPYDGYPTFEVATSRRRGCDGAHGGALPGGADASLDLIREAVASLAPGPSAGACGLVHDARAPSARPSRRAGRRSTGSRPDGERSAGFCKLRAASFMNFGVFNRVFDSQVLTDFSFIEHSLGLSPAGCDA